MFPVYDPDRPRFIGMRKLDGTWTIIDTETGETIERNGTIRLGLPERVVPGLIAILDVPDGQIIAK
jgi:hypothetical protein